MVHQDKANDGIHSLVGFTLRDLAWDGVDQELDTLAADEYAPKYQVRATVELEDERAPRVHSEHRDTL